MSSGGSRSLDFRIADLMEARFASVSEVPTPWLCLQDDIRRAGFDPAAMNREAGRSMAENADALREGRVDAIQVFEPFVEELVHEGAGHVWYAAARRGPTSYTTLYTSRRFAEADPDALSALAGGVMEALAWLHGHDAEALAERLQGYFPRPRPGPPCRRARALQGGRRLGPRPGACRWRASSG